MFLPTCSFVNPVKIENSDSLIALFQSFQSPIAFYMKSMLLPSHPSLSSHPSQACDLVPHFCTNFSHNFVSP